MYLWKIKNLKQDLKKNKLNKKDENLYLVFFTLLYLTLFIQSLIQINILWNIELVLVQVLISVLGIAYLYHKNSDTQTFRQNFTAVGWVFVLRSLFFMTLGMTNLYVMTHLFGIAELFSAKNAIIIGMIFELLLYWRIGSHLASLKV